MSILSISPVNTRHFDMEIASALGDINAAVIVQQLNYWMNKEGVGVIIDGIKYVYNSFPNWVQSQFRWLSVWQFRKAMNLLRSLSIVKVKRYKAKQWNQTNYYSLDYDHLAEYLKSQKAESIEISEMCLTTAQAEGNQTLDLRESELSYIETKKTIKKETAKQSAAASLKKPLEEESKPKQGNHHGEGLTGSNSQKKIKSEDVEPNNGEEKKVERVDYIVNTKWKEQVKELNSTGIPTNKTVVNLLKMYESEEVERAIALVKARKREQQISNLSGYFVSALKGDWGSQILAVGDESDQLCWCATRSKSFRAERNRQLPEGEKGVVFRHWYDLAKSLGYCSGQEVREGQQWVCLSGSWEQWEAAVNRGYSLEYLQKIIKRNQR